MPKVTYHRTGRVDCRVFVFWLYCAAVINRACLGHTALQTSSPKAQTAEDTIKFDRPSNAYSDQLDAAHWIPVPFHEVLGKHLDTKTHRCEPVTLSLCKGMYYPNTRMPNMFHHETQEEAGLEAHQFYPLVQINCSEDLRFLLCSIYTPICIDGYPSFLPPCRSICERVKAGCAPIMQHYNFPWPDRMSCDQFPEYNNPQGILCMERNLTESGTDASARNTPKPQMEQSTEKSIPITEEPITVATAEALLDRFSAEASQTLFTYELRNRTIVDWLSQDPDLKLVCRCQCVIPTGSSSTQTGETDFPSGINGCSVPCKIPHFSEDAPHGFTNYWLTLWSTLCAISTLLTMLTFILDAQRFQYPELPIIYLSTCYFMISLGYLTRVILGHESVVCDGAQGSEVTLNSFTTTTASNQLFSTLVPGYAKSMSLDTFAFDRVKILRFASTARASCAVVFLCVYFFGMASSVWWVILTFTWFLAAGLKWGSEAISKYSQVFHFIAWSVPTAFTALAMLLSVVEGDPASGLCTIGTGRLLARILFIFAPNLLCLTVGVIFLFAGFVALFRIRGAIKVQRIGVSKTDRLETLMLRIGIFGLLYSIPNVTILVCVAHELRDLRTWELGQLCECHYQTSLDISKNVPQWNPPKPDYTMFLIKHFMSLIIGVTSGFWIWSHKTWNSWRRFCKGGRCLQLSGGSQSGTVRLLPNTATVELDTSSKQNILPWIGFPSAVSMQTVSQVGYKEERSLSRFSNQRSKPYGVHSVSNLSQHHSNQLPLPPVPSPMDKTYYDCISQSNKTPSTTDQRQIRGRSATSDRRHKVLTEISDRPKHESSAFASRTLGLQPSASVQTGFQNTTNFTSSHNNWSALSSSGISSGLTMFGNCPNSMEFDGKFACEPAALQIESILAKNSNFQDRRPEICGYSTNDLESRDLYSKSSGHNSASSTFNDYPYHAPLSNSKVALSPQQQHLTSEYPGYYSSATANDVPIFKSSVPKDPSLTARTNITNDQSTSKSSGSSRSRKQRQGPSMHSPRTLANQTERTDVAAVLNF